jgi:hypothetical protein
LSEGGGEIGEGVAFGAKLGNPDVMGPNIEGAKSRCEPGFVNSVAVDEGSPRALGQSKKSRHKLFGGKGRQIELGVDAANIRQ